MGYGGRLTSPGRVKHSSSTLGGSPGSCARSTNRRATYVAHDCIDLAPLGGQPPRDERPRTRTRSRSPLRGPRDPDDLTARTPVDSLISG